MSLPSSFQVLFLSLSHVMAQPTFQSLLILLAGRVFARTGFPNQSADSHTGAGAPAFSWPSAWRCRIMNNGSRC